MTLRDPTFDLPTVHKVLAVGGYPYMQPNTRPQPRRTQDQGMTYRVSFSTAPMHPIEEAHTHISRNASEFSRKPRESSVPHTNAHLFPPWHQPHPTAFGEFRIAEKANPHIHLFQSRSSADRRIPTNTLSATLAYDKQTSKPPTACQAKPRKYRTSCSPAITPAPAPALSA